LVTQFSPIDIVDGEKKLYVSSKLIDILCRFHLFLYQEIHWQVNEQLH
jgi:hypothetical protein